MARITDTTPPPARPGLMLTERDQACIREVYDLRFLTTDDLMTLTGSKSRSKFNDRMRELWGNGYLDRPEFFVKHFAYADKRPTVHALGDAGAAWLRDHDGVRFPERMSWRVKNKDIKGADFALHTLGVSRTITRAVADIRGVGGLHLVRQAAVWQTSPSYNPGTPDPFALPTELHWIDGQVHGRKTKPDYTFILGDERSGTLRRGLTFLEYDRATEDYVRSSPFRPSILQKLLCYADAYRRELPKERFGLQRFRVLFVTEGDDTHIANIIKVYETHLSGGFPPRALLFTTTAALFEQGFLAPIWKDATGATTALVKDVGQDFANQRPAATARFRGGVNAGSAS